MMVRQITQILNFGEACGRSEARPSVDKKSLNRSTTVGLKRVEHITFDAKEWLRKCSYNDFVAVLSRGMRGTCLRRLGGRIPYRIIADTLGHKISNVSRVIQHNLPKAD